MDNGLLLQQAIRSWRCLPQRVKVIRADAQEQFLSRVGISEPRQSENYWKHLRWRVWWRGCRPTSSDAEHDLPVWLNHGSKPVRRMSLRSPQGVACPRIWPRVGRACELFKDEVRQIGLELDYRSYGLSPSIPWTQWGRILGEVKHSMLSSSHLRWYFYLWA